LSWRWGGIAPLVAHAGAISMTETNEETSSSLNLADPSIKTMMWYFSAVGMFVSAFTGVEYLLNEVLWKYANLDRSTARALLSNSRVDFCIQTLKRIIDANSLSGPKIAQLMSILDQLGIIARARNDILHFGATDITGDTVAVSNRLFAHVETRIRTLNLSEQVFANLNTDLLVMLLALLVHAYGTGGAIPADVAQLRWRYKQPSPSQLPHQLGNADKPR
jgi:hypothetical protein